MNISKFLAKVTGIYLIIISIALLINMQQFASYIGQLISNAPLMFVVGFFTLIVGILMVVSHNIWQWNWRIIITLIGWLILLKAVAIIFYPNFVDNISMSFVQNSSFAYAVCIFDLIIGIILCWFGFKKNI